MTYDLTKDELKYIIDMLNNKIKHNKETLISFKNHKNLEEVFRKNMNKNQLLKVKFQLYSETYEINEFNKEELNQINEYLVTKTNSIHQMIEKENNLPKMAKTRYIKHFNDEINKIERICVKINFFLEKLQE